MIKNEESLFSTHCIFLSSTLLSLGFEIELLNKNDARKIEFCFHRSHQLESAVQAFWAHQLKCEPQALFSSLKMLKNRIYSN